MIDRETLLEVFDIAERRRTERRRFLRMAGTAAAVTGAAGLLAACNNDDKSIPTSTPTPTATATSSLVASDVDILNFALNLEYLEANYYSFAAFGSGLNATSQTGTGTQGAVTGGAKVPFADASVAAYAREIAADENQHVLFLRQQLGSSAVAMPAINIDGGATGAFTAAARAAGVVDATSGTFNPYASDENWLLGGMLLSDVGVTAYKGSASLISSSVILDAAAGILAVEAYHSGLLRTLLYRKGLTMPALRTNADKISNARDTIDNATDDDVGISPMTVNGGTASSIVLADNNGIVYGRSAGDVLNVAFLNAGAVTSGGFFPAGVNGNIKTSTAG